MLSRRLIVCLDVADGRVVKGVRFESLRDMGDPAVLASHYELEGADEIVFLNIIAALDGETRIREVVRRAADVLFIPLTVGGGIGSVEQAGAMLRAGADKVSINSASVLRPTLITETAEKFGSQCVVASIDARREGKGWRVYTHGGGRRTELDAIRWAVSCAELGAGEILLTSIDQDGTKSGYDIELTRSVAAAVTVPVIASGGAGSAEDVTSVLLDGNADAALVAGLLHDGVTSVRSLKRAMLEGGLRVRSAA